MSGTRDPFYVTPKDPLNAYYGAKDMVYRLLRKAAGSPLNAPEYIELRKALEEAAAWYKEAP